MERTRKKGLLFGLMVVVVVYAMLSIAVAIATVDTCGDESSEKGWVIFPPKWECGSDDPVLLTP